jgi:hypothetical protein
MKLNTDDVNVTAFGYQSRESWFVESSNLLIRTGMNENLPRGSEFSSHADINWGKKISKQCR